MELPVILWMFIVSQIFGLINIAIAFYKFQIKDKSKTLQWSAAGNVFKIFNYAFLLNWSLAGLKVVSIFKNLAFAKLNKPDSKVRFVYSFAIFLFFSFISAAVVVVTWWFSRLWFEWVILAVVLFANFGKWVKGIHWIRISAVFYRIAMIFNSIFFFLNITNLIKAVVVLFSISIFYIRLLGKKIRGKRNSQEKEQDELQVELESSEVEVLK